MTKYHNLGPTQSPFFTDPMWNLISEVRSRLKGYQGGGIASSIQLKAVRSMTQLGGLILF